nr:MAG TPA: hypothetical protein [Caudoviricetes sp.]
MDICFAMAQALVALSSLSCLLCSEQNAVPLIQHISHFRIRIIGSSKEPQRFPKWASTLLLAYRIYQATSHTYENKDNQIRTVPFKVMAVFMEMKSSVKHRIKDLTRGKLLGFLRAALQIFIRIWLLPSSRREFTYNALFAMSNE